MLGNAWKCAVLVVLLVLTGTVFAGAVSPGTDGAAAAPATTPLDRFKALAGDWVAAEDGEMFHKGDLVARYGVTAAGSAVVETVFPGSPHEMVTVYHADGTDLVLTHYCMEGNAPRMRGAMRCPCSTTATGIASSSFRPTASVFQTTLNWAGPNPVPIVSPWMSGMRRAGSRS